MEKPKPVNSFRTDFWEIVQLFDEMGLFSFVFSLKSL
jgi:hypothetical protein